MASMPCAMSWMGRHRRESRSRWMWCWYVVKVRANRLLRLPCLLWQLLCGWMLSLLHPLRLLRCLLCKLCQLRLLHLL